MLPLFRSCFGFVVLASFASTALSQTPALSTEERTRLIAYDSFFFRFSWIEGTANELRAQGQPTMLGSSVVHQYGLTAEQYAQIATIATDWRTSYDSVIAQAKPLLAKGLTITTSQTLSDLLQRRRQVTRDHIAQLQAALGGPSRLAALEALITKPSSSGPILPKN